MSDVCLRAGPGSLLEKQEAPPSLAIKGDREVGLPVTSDSHLLLEGIANGGCVFYLFGSTKIVRK